MKFISSVVPLFPTVKNGRVWWSFFADNRIKYSDVTGHVFVHYQLHDTAQPPSLLDTQWPLTNLVFLYSGLMLFSHHERRDGSEFIKIWPAYLSGHYNIVELDSRTIALTSWGYCNYRCDHSGHLVRVDFPRAEITNDNERVEMSIHHSKRAIVRTIKDIVTDWNSFTPAPAGICAGFKSWPQSQIRKAVLMHNFCPFLKISYSLNVIVAAATKIIQIISFSRKHRFCQRVRFARTGMLYSGEELYLD